MSEVPVRKPFSYRFPEDREEQWCALVKAMENLESIKQRIREGEEVQSSLETSAPQIRGMREVFLPYDGATLLLQACAILAKYGAKLEKVQTILGSGGMQVDLVSTDETDGPDDGGGPKHIIYLAVFSHTDTEIVTSVYVRDFMANWIDRDILRIR